MTREMLARLADDEYKMIVAGEWKSKDLSFLDLTGRDFAGLDLSGHYLAGSDLRGSSFRGANLRGSALVEYETELDENGVARQTGRTKNPARVDGANFRAADLTATLARGLAGDDVDFNGANLESADLADAALRNSDFRAASIGTAVLEGADVTGSKFDGVNWERGKNQFPFITGMIGGDGRELICLPIAGFRAVVTPHQIAVGPFQTRVDLWDEAVRNGNLYELVKDSGAMEPWLAEGRRESELREIVNQINERYGIGFMSLVMACRESAAASATA